MNARWPHQEGCLTRVAGFSSTCDQSLASALETKYRNHFRFKGGLLGQVGNSWTIDCVHQQQCTLLDSFVSSISVTKCPITRGLHHHFFERDKIIRSSNRQKKKNSSAKPNLKKTNRKRQLMLKKMIYAQTSGSTSWCLPKLSAHLITCISGRNWCGQRILAEQLNEAFLWFFLIFIIQKAIDEVDYAVSNIATDLRDGLRLT